MPHKICLRLSILSSLAASPCLTDQSIIHVENVQQEQNTVGQHEMEGGGRDSKKGSVIKYLGAVEGYIRIAAGLKTPPAYYNGDDSVPKRIQFTSAGPDFLETLTPQGECLRKFAECLFFSL